MNKGERKNATIRHAVKPGGVLLVVSCTQRSQALGYSQNEWGSRNIALLFTRTLITILRDLKTDSFLRGEIMQALLIMMNVQLHLYS